MGFVQGTSANNNASGGALTATFGAGVGAGNCVWGLATWGDATSTPTITVGGVSATILDTIRDVGNASSASTFILGNISGAPTSVVFTPSASATFRTVVAIEESGCLAVANPTDVHTGQLQTTPGTGANILTSGNATTTVANDIIVGASTNETSGTTVTAGTSPNAFTLRTTNAAGIPVSTEDEVIKAVAGAVAATFGQTVNNTNITLMIAIKPSSGTVVVSNWFAPLSEPPRSNPRLLPSQQQAIAFPVNFSIPSHGWFAPLSEPIRRQPPRPPTQDIFFPVNFSIPSFGWFEPLSEPTRRPLPRPPPVDEGFVTVITPAAPSFGWFAPLAEPARLPPRSPIGARPDLAFPVNFSIPSFGWYGPLSEPTRRPRSPVGWMPDLAFSVNFFVPSFGWFAPLSEPPRPPPRLTERQWLALPPFPIIPSFGWYGPLSEPVRPPPKLLASQQQTLAYGWFTPPTTVTFGWFVPLTEPVRAPRKLPSGAQPNLAYPVNFTVPSHGWFSPLSEPARRLPRLRLV